jgi:peptidoglycan/xylan/chitin deacetylase (PgdA/CDA1 family)
MCIRDRYTNRIKLEQEVINIKVNIKVIIISILIALFMYPKTIDFLITSAENISVAYKLNTCIIQSNKNTVDSDKTKIVFMLDDGWESIYTDAFDVLEKYDYTASMPIIPSMIDEKEYMSYEQLSKLFLQGWDLVNHSYSHKENAYENTNELLSDFNRAREWMKNRFMGNCSDMVVLPYGEINPYLIRQLKDAGYRNVRTSSNIIVLDKNDIEYYPVTTISLLTDVTVNKVKEMLLQRVNEPRTIIFILHKIGDRDNGFGMTYSKENLEEIILFLTEHSDEFEVVSYSQLFK